MKYLTFDLDGPSDSGKTNIWSIYSRDRLLLGEVRWHGPWRKYVFRTTEAGVMFDGGCLREIIEFCESRTEEHKEKA